MLARAEKFQERVTDFFQAAHNFLISAQLARIKTRNGGFYVDNRTYKLIMSDKISGFDWDSGNLTKCQKHGVSIAEIEFALGNDPRITPGFSHSGGEVRYIAVGRTQEGRAVFIAFTLRPKASKLLVRPISARYMHKREIEAYEKENP